MHFRNVDAGGRRYRERVIDGKAYRYYADEGRRLGSVWTDIPAMVANTPLRREGDGLPDAEAGAAPRAHRAGVEHGGADGGRPDVRQRHHARGGGPPRPALRRRRQERARHRADGGAAPRAGGRVRPARLAARRRERYASRMSTHALGLTLALDERGLHPATKVRVHLVAEVTAVVPGIERARPPALGGPRGRHVRLDGRGRRSST